jgi:glycosyltransferase involved in cell wall biosynthesis
MTGSLDQLPIAIAPDRAASRTLKVLQVGKFYPPHMGGIETHLRTLCSSLRGPVQLSVLVAGDGPGCGTEVIDGIQVERARTWLTLSSAPLCPAMRSRIRQSDADLIHVHLPNPTAVLAYMASGSRRKLVVTYHSDTVRQTLLGTAFEPILDRFLEQSAAIIVTSPNYLETSRVLARHRDRCHVIPYGIPLQQFETCDPAAIDGVRQKFGERLLLGVGRLVYYKGFEYLIEAMSSVKGKLLLVGTGPLLKKLQAHAAARGVSDRVVFLGEIQNEDVTPYYHASDVFVLPSIARSEAFGIVQIEAMAAGKPVINTSLDSGVPFVSQHGLTGLTVPPANPAALANAINQILDDAKMRKEYGVAARRRAEQEFSEETMTARVLSLYQHVVHSSPNSL